MRSVSPMKTAKIGYITISIALCIIGIILIAIPEFSSSLLGIICSILLMIFGIIRIIGYFSKDLYRLAFQYDFAFGAMMILLGILMLVHPGSLINFICITIGLSFLTDGLFKIQIALESQKFGLKKWWLILASAVITGICGGILMFRPSESSNILTVLIGITLLSEGLMNLSTVITAVKIIKHQQPDVIEFDFEDQK